MDEEDFSYKLSSPILCKCARRVGRIAYGCVYVGRDGATQDTPWPYHTQRDTSELRVDRGLHEDHTRRIALPPPPPGFFFLRPRHRGLPSFLLSCETKEEEEEEEKRKKKSTARMREGRAGAKQRDCEQSLNHLAIKRAHKDAIRYEIAPLVTLALADRKFRQVERGRNVKSVSARGR